MARLARLHVPDCPVLLELQGVGGQPVFHDRETFLMFHERLPISAQTEGLKLYSYCLTPEKAQMLIGVSESNQTGRFVQDLNRHFVAQTRRRNPHLTGCIWEPRFKSTAVQPGFRSLKACLFVELQAFRDGVSSNPESYPWSSYRVHIGSAREPWLSELSAYWQLGNTPFEREAQYERFAEQGLGQTDWAELDECLQKGWLWGDLDFCNLVEPLANRPVRPRKRGRPKSNQ